MCRDQPSGRARLLVPAAPCNGKGRTRQSDTLPRLAALRCQTLALPVPLSAFTRRLLVPLVLLTLLGLPARLILATLLLLLLALLVLLLALLLLRPLLVSILIAH